jgi:hypothetical protein
MCIHTLIKAEKRENIDTAIKLRTILGQVIVGA